MCFSFINEEHLPHVERPGLREDGAEILPDLLEFESIVQVLRMIAG
jgi:hypothetical protein